MDILYYFLPGILILGIITSFTDIKYGKIRNRLIIFALAYGMIVNFLLISYTLSQGNLRFEYISELTTNILFGLGVGFSFWLSKIWTAGDGKLFFSYSVLMPLTVYQNGYIRWIPSAILLINVFVPMFFYFAVSSIFKSSWDIKKIIIKEIYKKYLMNLFFSLFVIHWVLNLFTSAIKLNSIFLKAIILAFIYSIIRKRYKNKTIKKQKVKFIAAILLIFVARLIFDSSIYTSNYWIEFFSFFFFLILLSGIKNLSVEAFSRNIAIKNLKPGMILAESIIKKGSKYQKEKFTASNKDENFIEEQAEGITSEDIKKIQKTGIKNIKVKQTIPFAPFLFFGVLLTIIAKGNILILVRFFL